MENKVTTPNISYFNPPISNTKPTKKVSYMDVYQLVTSDVLKEITQEVRSLENPKLIRDLKSKYFPHITPSGICYTRCIDIDDIESEEQLQVIKQKLIDDPNFYTLLLFRSPLGKGLKWFTPIDLSLCGHRKWFEAIRNYLYQTYGIVADEKCVNTSRSCFLCYDPDCYACKEIINNLTQQNV